jgi:acyl-coenzyme A synthetase/AMP-(fatty) acid ligase
LDVGQGLSLPYKSGRPEARPTRFWFCGRKSHRVITPQGTLFTIPCEAIFNQHPWVYRSALVGAGMPGKQTPVMIVEPWPEHRLAAIQAYNKGRFDAELRQLALQHAHTSEIEHFVCMAALPVDIRHNAKIFREKLAKVAESFVSHKAYLRARKAKQSAT